MKKQVKQATRGTSTVNRTTNVTLLGQLCLSDQQKVHTVAALVRHISGQCVASLVGFVQFRNPLQAMTGSAVIWLRPDGLIELDRTKIGERVNRPEDLCFIEEFSSLADATPDSYFHQRIPDLGGPYVGEIYGAERRLYAPWTYMHPTMEDYDGCVGISRLPHQSEVPFRIEPELKSSVSALLKSQIYKEDLESRIFHWLLQGKYPASLKKLSVFGLKDAAIEVPKLVAAYGADDFIALLRDRTKQAITARTAA